LRLKADGKDGPVNTGVIAQEVLKIHPDLIQKDTDGMYMVKEPGTWRLVKVIQELTAANNNLKADQDRLRADFEAYKATHH
jgi:hypothetical protein